MTPIDAESAVASRATRSRRTLAIGLAAAFVLSGCTSPTVLEGSTVTVASTTALFSLNDRTSYGNSPANSSVLQATSSSFHRYDDESTLVLDPSFGTYQLLSNDPLTVKYTIAEGAVWSDGVPVDAADLLLAWVANSGALNTPGVVDSGYRDAETGRYATPFAEDVVYFDGATSEGLQYVTAVPTVSEESRSVTLTWDSYVVDWPLLLQVGLPAHVVAAKALGLPLAPDTHAEGLKADAERSADAEKAKAALVKAIAKNDVPTLSKIANFWNSGFDLESMPEDDSILISTGPYTITEFTPTESVTLTANPRYHGAHSPVFETVLVRFIPEPLDQVAALAEGSVDVVVPKAGEEVLAALKAVSRAEVLVVPGVSYEHLDLSFTQGKHSTFQDARVREAFLKTIPLAEIRTEVMGSALGATAERSSFIFLPGEPGYAKAESGNGSAQYARPDIAGATELLTAAGVASPEVCMMFDPSNPKRVTEFQLIAESASLAGFVVTNCSGPDWRNLLGVPGVYDASIFAWTAANTSVAGLQSIYGEGGQGNLNGFASQKAQALLTELAVTPDPKDQNELRFRLDALLYSEAYGLPLYQEQGIVAHSTTLAGVRPATLASGVLWNIWEWAPVAPVDAE